MLDNTLNPLPADVRLRRGAEHLTSLGARATAEFLAEAARVHGIERRPSRWRG
jgi:hypothetical protein